MPTDDIELARTGSQIDPAREASLGPELYANALPALEHAANALRRGDIASATSGIGFGRIYDLVASAS